MFCTNCGQPTDTIGRDGQDQYSRPYVHAQMNAGGTIEKKNEFIALILAIFIPGAGHIYLGRVARGIGILITYLALNIVTSGHSFYSHKWDHERPIVPIEPI